MEINTKYNYLESLWYMKDNKPTTISVSEFKIECLYSGYADGGWGTKRTFPIKIYYRTNYSKPTEWIPEEKLFKTKEELINSL